MTIAEKRKKAAAIAAEIRKQATEFETRKAAAEKDPATKLWPDETEKRWKDTNAEYDKLRTEIEEDEKNASVSARINEVNEWEQRSTNHGRQNPGLDDMNPETSRAYGEDYSDRDEARHVAQRHSDQRAFMRSWIASQVDPDIVTPEMRQACARLKASPDRPELNFRLLDTQSYRRALKRARLMHQDAFNTDDENAPLQRAMSVGGVGQGAELVPISFISALELAMLATSPMFAYCDVMRTATGEDIRWPLGDDTGNIGTQITEMQDISALPQPDPVLTQLTMRAWNFTSNLVRVSVQLTVDSLVSIDLILANLLGERLGRIKLQSATTGNGTTAPGGVVTQSAAGITTALATAITGDETIRLQHSVDPLYRQGSIYMAHDNIIAALRLLKDSQNRYLWSSGLADSRPDLLNGQPIVYNQYMAATIATTNITMLYGNFGYYKVREVGDIMVRRLVERYAELLQIGFLAHQRFDSRLARWAAAGPTPIKRLTQA